jgi:hypothetical protein
MRGVGIPIYTFRRILDYRRVSQSKLHTAILRNSMLIWLLEISYMGIVDIQHLQNSSYTIFHNYGFTLQDISTLIILESPSAFFHEISSTPSQLWILPYLLHCNCGTLSSILGTHWIIMRPRFLKTRWKWTKPATNRKAPNERFKHAHEDLRVHTVIAAL